MTGRYPTEEEREEMIDRAEQFKEEHSELFERLAEDPTAESVMRHLTLENAAKEDTVERFVWVLQECAWAPEDDKPKLPRVPPGAGPRKTLAYGIVMNRAIEELRDKTLARLLMEYLGRRSDLNSPENTIFSEAARRISPELFEEDDRSQD